MSIIASELQWFNTAQVSDANPAANGGRPTQTQNVSGVKNNIFPDVSAAQRAAGVTHWRKKVIQVKNADNLPLVDPKISIESGTPGDSHVLLHPGTWTDTQATMTGRPYGYGTLASPASAAATAITVTSEADFSALDPKPFQVGDLVRVDARADVTQAGLSEYAEIDTVSYDEDTLTIGLAAGLTNGYAAGVHVASVIEPGDLEASVTAKAVTGGVTYDDTLHPIGVPQLGGIYQVWTLTLTAAGAISVVGDTVGAVGTGSTGVNLAPANPLGGTYFTLAAAGWGGTVGEGDTLEFTTVPAGCPVWYQRVVPPGAAAIASDPVDLCIEGES